MPRPAFRIAAVLAMCALLVGCGSGGPSAATPTRPVAAASLAAPSASPEASGAPTIPTACVSLGEPDCGRAAAAAMAALAATDPAPVYLQVGPFGCRNGERCPTTLAARPEGDVIVEFAGVPAVAIHLVAGADGALTPTRGETFGMILPPGSARATGPGPIALELGHCGVYSGIDVDGRWWDPVGPIDGDHPDFINAAPGRLQFDDPTHATFVSADGFVVHLLSRNGPKHLPMCQ